MKFRLGWKKFHKWAGLLTAVFLLIFCASGIIMNHRAAFSGIDVTRKLLPADYHLKNFNNGIIRGTLPLDSMRLMAFGNSGLWLTDRSFSSFADFNEGLPKGADNRQIRNVVIMRDGNLWCATQFGLFRRENNGWKEITLPGNDERISDLTLTPDSTGLIVLGRSAIYRVTPDGASECKQLAAPADYKPRVTLFKTVWQLHSGELFGTAGRIVVDIIALVIIFLCITGIILFILPYRIRRLSKKHLTDRIKPTARKMKWNFRWHDKAGAVTIIFTVIIAFTGMCLRPPLMIPLVLTETSPLPGSNLDSDNAWHDKLRGIRWDENLDKWIVSTTEGFFTFDRNFSGAPGKPGKAPAISPMGVNVFEKEGEEWLIGSFSGLYRWNPEKETVTDYLTGKASERQGGRPVSTHLVSGFSTDLGTPTVFDFSTGAAGLPEMPEELASQPMSLWNVALELHVGRCYTPFLGPLSSLFVFLAGLIITLVLISGYIVHHRHKKRSLTK